MVATEWAAAIVVCDAGPLIHLDEMDCLDLLVDFPAIIIPEAVWHEVERHRPTALSRPSLPFERARAGRLPQAGGIDASAVPRRR